MLWESCWYHFLIASRSGFLAALLWFLRIPSLYFFFSDLLAKVQIFHIFLLWHIHWIKILSRPSFTQKSTTKERLLHWRKVKECLTFLFVLYGSFQLSYTSQTVLTISKNIHHHNSFFYTSQKQNNWCIF